MSTKNKIQKISDITNLSIQLNNQFKSELRDYKELLKDCYNNDYYDLIIDSIECKIDNNESLNNNEKEFYNLITKK